MKKVIISLIILISTSVNSYGQEFMSTYNLSQNDSNSLRIYEEEYKYNSDHSLDLPTRRKPNRLAKGLMYTGVLVGGLVLAEQATHHDYFINNTMIYGLGGVMTILATGLVISSVHGINKQLFVAYTGTGIKVSMTI